MSVGGETKAAVLAKGLAAAAVLGASNLILGQKWRPRNDGHPPQARSSSNDDDAHSRHVDLATYAIGYFLALGLTGFAFALVHWRWATARSAFGIVLCIGLLQAIVHVRCFLHVDLTRSSRDDRQLILFTTLIVLLMVGGTLVVLFNLRTRMM